MKVILRDNIPSLGSLGDTVVVAEGYGRNYLLPKGLAVKTSPGNLKAVSLEKISRLKKEMTLIEGFKVLAQKISAKSYSIACKVGDEDKLFGSVTTADIAQLINDAGFTVDKRKVKLANPLNQLGDYSVEIKLHPEVTLSIDVSLIKE
jgi:large subunit ribosomal protein L9